MTPALLNSKAQDTHGRGAAAQACTASIETVLHLFDTPHCTAVHRTRSVLTMWWGIRWATSLVRRQQHLRPWWTVATSPWRVGALLCLLVHERSMTDRSYTRAAAPQYNTLCDVGFDPDIGGTRRCIAAAHRPVHVTLSLSTLTTCTWLWQHLFTPALRVPCCHCGAAGSCAATT